MGVRFYNSEIGRWLSIDPLANNYPGWSQYNYCFNNTLNHIDPNGKYPWFITGISERERFFGVNSNSITYYGYNDDERMRVKHIEKNLINWIREKAPFQADFLKNNNVTIVFADMTAANGFSSMTPVTENGKLYYLMIFDTEFIDNDQKICDLAVHESTHLLLDQKTINYLNSHFGLGFLKDRSEEFYAITSGYAAGFMKGDEYKAQLTKLFGRTIGDKEFNSIVQISKGVGKVLNNREYLHKKIWGTK